MSWDARDYDGITFESERAEREEIREGLLEELETRMENFRADRCSYIAALRGGDEYQAEVREALALEETESRLVAAAMVKSTLERWAQGAMPGAPPRMAAIGNGLFVRVGTGRKRRAA